MQIRKNHIFKFATFKQPRQRKFFRRSNHSEAVELAKVTVHARVLPRGVLNSAPRLSYEESTIQDREDLLISDVGDTTGAVSVQMFVDNAVNPCIDGTYRLVSVASA